MEAQVDSASVIPIGTSRREACHEEFSLSRLQRGEKDKLGNIVLEILWLSPDYGIYCTKLGVFIHFSDDKAKEAVQRTAFMTICPELCELRYLTSEMHGMRFRMLTFLKKAFFGEEAGELTHSLFDHNIAQSLMLLMEGKEEDAKAIATAALDMAIQRITNDNTIRYVRTALVWAVTISVILGGFYAGTQYVPVEGMADQAPPFLIACFYGVVGAAFSIMTRVEAFEMKPCQQSNMNAWMALIRIMIGLIGGFAFFLLVQSSFGQALVHPDLLPGWKRPALIGFLGGFAERMVQTVFKRTASGIEGRTGTPVQRARRVEKEALGTAGVPALR